MTDFSQQTWDPLVADDCTELLKLAVREDLSRAQDWTTLSLVPGNAQGAAKIVARETGVVAGLPIIPLAIEQCQLRLQWQPLQHDGAAVAAGTVLGRLEGNARDLLTSERILLNFLGRLSGIATHTARFVGELTGTTARLYDTRKTTPGWRRLEKYAVRCGGGTNHRAGLYDAILIKDNHLAFAAQQSGTAVSPAEAVTRARKFVEELQLAGELSGAPLVEIELDDLNSFNAVLKAGPDIVLLDNMSLDDLRRAVALRNETAPRVELEASGGVRLNTISDIATTGVDRISCGALTHSAVNFDVALDWEYSA